MYVRRSSVMCEICVICGKHTQELTPMRRVLVSTGSFVILALSASLGAQTAPTAGRAPGGRGTPIQSGEQCPPGETEIRPRSCMAPDAPAPSILDYRPHSTLVTATHL